MKTLLFLSFALFLIVPSAFARGRLSDFRRNAQTEAADSTTDPSTAFTASATSRQPTSEDQTKAACQGYESAPSQRITNK